MKKKLTLGVFSIVILSLFLLFPTSFLALPEITPSDYLDSVPYFSIGNIIFIKPTSTFLVYLLGLVTILFGYKLYKDKSVETKTWWGIALILWGIGTLLAGSSYQGFGYELKCTVDEYCLFTSWFELSYLYVTALSITVMAYAVSIKTLQVKERMLYSKITIIGFFIYSLVLLLGVLLGIRFLVTYEMFLVFFLPYFISFFVLNLKGYKKDKNDLDKGQVIIWLLMLLINILYFAYYYSGIAEVLYENNNIWFSANDVLHIGLIGWMYYIYNVIKKAD